MVGWIALTLAGAAAAQTAPALRVNPAMRNDGMIFVVEAREAGQITRCRPAEPLDAGPAAKAGCAALTAKGVPPSVAPATAMSDPAGWIDTVDFPETAIAAARGASIELIYEVDEGGRISDCRIYRSSGDAEVDRYACASLSAHALFSPAHYKGQATPAVGIHAMQFPAE